MSAILADLPTRFWIYAVLLGFVAGLMTGAARLPWWSGAVASMAATVATLGVIVALMWLRRSA
jgi:hypothetical protein